LARDRYYVLRSEGYEEERDMYMPTAAKHADAQVREEFGNTFELVNLGKRATLDHLTKELAVEERLDAMIDKCLKRLLFLRGLKSLAPTQSASSTAETSSAPVRRLRLT